MKSSSNRRYQLPPNWKVITTSKSGGEPLFVNMVTLDACLTPPFKVTDLQGALFLKNRLFSPIPVLNNKAAPDTTALTLPHPQQSNTINLTPQKNDSQTAKSPNHNQYPCDNPHPTKRLKVGTSVNVPIVLNDDDEDDEDGGIEDDAKTQCSSSEIPKMTATNKSIAGSDSGSVGNISDFIFENDGGQQENGQKDQESKSSSDKEAVKLTDTEYRVVDESELVGSLLRQRNAELDKILEDQTRYKEHVLEEIDPYTIAIPSKEILLRSKVQLPFSPASVLQRHKELNPSQGFAISEKKHNDRQDGKIINEIIIKKRDRKKEGDNFLVSVRSSRKKVARDYAYMLTLQVLYPQCITWGELQDVIKHQKGKTSK